MNERITLLGNKAIQINKSSMVREPVALSVDGERLWITGDDDVAFDTPSRDALIEALQCLRDTNSFAALADTSPVPYCGKRMRHERLSETITITSILNGHYGYMRADGTQSIVSASLVLPIAPPVPKVRPYKNGLEAAVLLGLLIRRKDGRSKSMRVDAIELGQVRSFQNRTIDFKELADCWETCDITECEPCGIVEPTPAAPG